MAVPLAAADAPKPHFWPRNPGSKVAKAPKEPPFIPDTFIWPFIWPPVIPSDAVRSRAKRRGSMNPFFSVAQRFRWCRCGMASGALRKGCSNRSLHSGPSIGITAD